MLSRLMCIWLLSLFASFSSAATWTEYKSDNFVLYTDSAAKNVQQIVAYAEQYQQVLQRFLAQEPKVTPIDIVVYSSNSDFRKLAMGADSAGFLMYNKGRPTVVMGLPYINSDRQVIFQHIYASHYMGNVRHSYPQWFSLGMAEFFSVTEVKDDVALVGQFHLRHSWPRSKPLVPLSELVAPKDRLVVSDGVMQTSWYFIHFLLLGILVGEHDYQEALGKYLEMSSNLALSVERREEVFVNTFGKTPKEMDKELEGYRKRDSLKMFRLPLKPYSGAVTARVMERNEALLMLSGIAKWRKRYDMVGSYLKKMDKNSAAASEVSNWLVKHEELQEGSSIEKALLKKFEASPSDPVQVSALLEHYHRQHINTVMGKGREESAKRVIEYGDKLLALDPAQKNAHRILHLAYNTLRNNEKVIEHLQAAYDLDPQDSNTAYMLGMRLYTDKRYAEAIPYLEQALNNIGDRPSDLLEQRLDDARKNVK